MRPLLPASQLQASRIMQLGTGGVMAVILVLAYAYAWNPARTAAVRHVAYPLIKQSAAEGGRARLQARRVFFHAPGEGSAATRMAEGRTTKTYHPPVGVRFLIGALLLVVLFPFRPYWVVLWGLHLLLAAALLAAFSMGATGRGWGFGLYHFLHTYIVPAVSFGMPAVAYVRERDLLYNPSSHASAPAIDG